MPTARRSESRPCGDGPVHRGEVPDGRTCRRCYRVSLNWSRLGACRPRRVDDRRPAPAASDVSRIRTRAPRDREPDHGPDGVPSFGASACAAGRRSAMIRPPEIIRPREGAPMPAPNLSNPALGRRTLIRGGLGAASLSRSQGRNRATVDRDTQPRSASRAHPVRAVHVPQSVWVARIAARHTRRSAASARKSARAASRTAAVQARRSRAGRCPAGTARRTRNGVSCDRYAAGPCPRRHGGDQAPALRRRARPAVAARTRAPAALSAVTVLGTVTALVRRPVAAGAVTAAGGAGHALRGGTGHRTHGKPTKRRTIRARPDGAR